MEYVVLGVGTCIVGFSNPLAFRLDNVLRFADDILKNAQLEFSSLYRCLHVYELLSKEKV